MPCEGEMHTTFITKPRHHCPYTRSSQYISLIIMALSFISKRPYEDGFDGLDSRVTASFFREHSRGLIKRRKRERIAREEPMPNSKMSGTEPAILCSQEKFANGMDAAHGLRLGASQLQAP